MNFLGHTRFHSFFKRHHDRLGEKAKGVIFHLNPLRDPECHVHKQTIGRVRRRNSASSVQSRCWFAASAADDGEG